MRTGRRPITPSRPCYGVNASTLRDSILLIAVFEGIAIRVADLDLDGMPIKKLWTSSLPNASLRAHRPTSTIDVLLPVKSIMSLQFSSRPRLTHGRRAGPSSLHKIFAAIAMGIALLRYAKS